MSFSPVYFHLATDVSGCRTKPETQSYIRKLEAFSGIKFIHQELDVTQGTSSVRHRAMGIDFDDPIGGFSDKGGTVKLVALWNHFRRQVHSRMLRSGVKLPLFSVVDHNSAHHMAYILSRYAFQHLPINPANKAMLITFDEHTDQQTGFSNNDIKCSNYVVPLLTPPNKVVDVVVHIGWDFPTGSENLHGTNVFTPQTVRRKARKRDTPGRKFGNITTQPTVSTVRVGVKDNYIEHIRKVMEEQSVYYVYITVDRDFMKGSCTRYGDGESHPDTARLAVKDCLETIRELNCQIVGFDITGMPTGNKSTALTSNEFRLQNLITSKRMRPVPQVGDYQGVEKTGIELAFQDVLFYYQALADAMLI